MRKWAPIALILFSLSGSAYATPTSHKKHHKKNLIERIISLFRGSKEKEERQNEVADKDELVRFEDDAAVREAVKSGALVSLPETEFVHVDPRLEPELRYCMPQTREFLLAAGKKSKTEVGLPLQVNSAVRTVPYQRKLKKHNPNAADADGPYASSHLTGATVDIAKKPMNRRQRIWFRKYLLPLQQAGKIEVVEEFNQAVFHVMVFKSYAP